MNPLATHWLPTDPPRPCPDVLTADEAIAYLRLDTTGAKSPRRSLDDYRASGRIRGTRVGSRIMYRRIDLDTFLADQAAA
jgi:hypothetical protein